MPSTPGTVEVVQSPVLCVRDLGVRYGVGATGLQAVSEVSLEIGRGEIVGVVGESGSGKSQILLGIMGLLPDGGTATGSVRFLGQEILNLPQRQLDRMRGAALSMIFQDPMTCLTPHLRISRQLSEVLVRHRGLSERAAIAEAMRMLELVQIPDARRRIHLYPHEFPGGMRQRVMIAMALLCRPALLLADEPTTALDATVQAQILELIAELVAELGMSVLIVTHDFGVVAELCDRVVVLYGGSIMESGETLSVLRAPRHPYTRGLIAAMPVLDRTPGEELYAIPGQARPGAGGAGCPFWRRCGDRISACAVDRPPLVTGPAGRQTACHLVAAAESDA